MIYTNLKYRSFNLPIALVHKSQLYLPIAQVNSIYHVQLMYKSTSCIALDLGSHTRTKKKKKKKKERERSLLDQ